MKGFRAFLMSLLVGFSLWILPGCATPQPASTSGFSPAVGMKGIEQKQPAPTADMNWAEKSGYYLGWVCLEALYAFAAGNPSFSP